MAEEGKNQSYESKVEETPVDVKAEETTTPAGVETTSRGLFGFFGKKEEGKTCETDAIATEFDDKVKVSDEEKKVEEPIVCEEVKKEEPMVYEEEKKEEPKHESLLQKLERSSSSSSSSSDEEYVDENGEKKKKKKIKDKIKEKLSGEKKEEVDTSVPIEKCDEVPATLPEAEKKGLLEKIKDKLPGKKHEEVATPPPVVVAEPHPEGEKKGFMDKIKEKIPGYHPKTAEEKKEGAC